MRKTTFSHINIQNALCSLINIFATATGVFGCSKVQGLVSSLAVPSLLLYSIIPLSIKLQDVP